MGGYCTVLDVSCYVRVWYGVLWCAVIHLYLRWIHLDTPIRGAVLDTINMLQYCVAEVTLVTSPLLLSPIYFDPKTSFSKHNTAP